MHRNTGQQARDDGQRFLEPADAPARGVEADARRAVFRRVPPRADAQLEPATRQVVQARRLVRDDRGVPEVVGEHQRAHAQVCRHRGCGRQRAERRKLLAERTR
jgi:hypothetical protein